MQKHRLRGRFHKFLKVSDMITHRSQRRRSMVHRRPISATIGDGSSVELSPDPRGSIMPQSNRKPAPERLYTEPNFSNCAERCSDSAGPSRPDLTGMAIARSPRPWGACSRTRPGLMPTPLTNHRKQPCKSRRRITECAGLHAARANRLLSMSDVRHRAVPEEAPKRLCNECGEPMRHLTDFRRFGGRPAKRIFRCYRCDNVISEMS